jgi:hypothetical protein
MQGTHTRYKQFGDLAEFKVGFVFGRFGKSERFTLP